MEPADAGMAVCRLCALWSSMPLGVRAAVFRQLCANTQPSLIS